MLLLALFLGALASDGSANRKVGVNQMHVAYLSEFERSVSWTSLTEKDPITLIYQLAVPGPEGIGFISGFFCKGKIE